LQRQWPATIVRVCKHSTTIAVATVSKREAARRLRELAVEIDLWWDEDGLPWAEDLRAIAAALVERPSAHISGGPSQTSSAASGTPTPPGRIRLGR
jgi:hypothetical protein